MTTKTSFRPNAYGNASIDKDPESILDYSMDWSAWLLGVEDSISTYTVVGVDCTVQNSSKNGNVLTAWISGGTIGQSASVTFKIVTAGGRTDERTVYFNIKQR